MISTSFHQGQGLGNQLWCYVTTRVVALKNGFGFGMTSPENFKGQDFMKIDFGLPVSNIRTVYTESALYHLPSLSDIRQRDEKLVNPQDNTQIEGLMQDTLYIEEYRDQIRSWLKVDAAYDCRDYCNDDICVINFRGGGYTRDVDFFLPPTYWNNCIDAMKRINPKFKFIVVSDDPTTARMFFPNFEVHHWSIGKDYSVIKNARYLILSNSSFAWFPAWLSTDLKYCIAPKYWARHNISDGYWSLGYNITPGWYYMDRRGQLSDYETCIRELEKYLSHTPPLSVANPPTRHSFALTTKNIIYIFSTLRHDFAARSVLKKMSILYTIHTILNIRDWTRTKLQKSLVGKHHHTSTAQPPRSSTGSSGKLRGIKMALKRISVTQGYY